MLCLCSANNQIWHAHVQEDFVWHHINFSVEIEKLTCISKNRRSNPIRTWPPLMHKQLHILLYNTCWKRTSSISRGTSWWSRSTCMVSNGGRSLRLSRKRGSTRRWSRPDYRRLQDESTMNVNMLHSWLTILKLVLTSRKYLCWFTLI